MKNPASKNSKDLLEVIGINNWLDTLVIRDRVATEEDVESGIAAFVLKKTKAEPYRIDLPALAEIRSETPNQKSEMKKIVIIQAEKIADGDVMVGYRFLNGKYGVATFNEVTLEKI